MGEGAGKHTGGGRAGHSGPPTGRDMTPDVKHGGGSGRAPLLVPFVKSKRAQNVNDDETWKDGEVSPTLNAFDNGGDSRATVVTVEQQVEVWSFDSTWSGAYGVCADQTPPMKCGNGTVPAIASEVDDVPLAVRRLTPRECERLFGWPDDWTRWTADDKEVADSNRYRMCGNGVASPVAEWIGRCILDAEGGVA
jgi:site-specific DNA-cytosine methylase